MNLIIKVFHFIKKANHSAFIIYNYFKDMSLIRKMPLSLTILIL